MKFYLLLFKIFLCFFFIINIDCALGYVSLKELCHHGNPTIIPSNGLILFEAIQKKIYAILAPLFSQRPWTSREAEPKISDKDYSKLQAAIYILILHSFPKELVAKIFPQKLFDIRQYKSFYSQSSFIPFLYNNKVWSLEDTGGVLKSCVGYNLHFDGVKIVPFEPSDSITLSVVNGFNCPMAVLKTSQKSTIMCLFRDGFISVVDLDIMKEIWFRKYELKKVDDKYNNLIYNDNYGQVITGYKDIICFLESNKNEFNFYYFSDLKDQKKYSYQIQNHVNNQKFQMLHTNNFGSPRAMNSKYLFYAFFQKKYVDQDLESYWVHSCLDQVSTQLYYISYKEEQNEEKIFYTLQDEESFFKHLVCNDICLIAQDNNKKIYIWDLTQEPCVLRQVIHHNDNMLPSEFWLDNCSEKILTRYGVFKIQDVFGGLPRVPPIQLKQITESPKPLEPKNSLNPEKPLNRNNGFFKNVCIRIYWFVRSWYWAMKQCLYRSANFVLRRLA